MPTQPPNITPVPQPPIQRGDRATFSGRVDAFIIWLAAAVAQFTAVATNVYNNAVEAFQSAAAAATSASFAASQAAAAQAVTGVAAFNASKAYAAGEAAFSLINGQTYRRLSAGTSSTNPANDQTNWRLIAGNDINGTFVPIPVTGTVIDLSLGNYFTASKGTNTNFSFTNVPSGGASFTLELALTAAVLVGFPTSVRSPGNVAPGFQANKMHKLMLVTSNGGTRFTMSAVGPFDI